MRLYYASGSCALASHIVAREAKLPVELSKVTFSADGRTTEQGEDFYKVNPRGGYVPALRLDNDEVLVEGAAIIQYLADQAPDSGLVPEKGTMAHYRLLEWITFVSTELHKGFGAFFRADASEGEKDTARAKLEKRFAYANEWLAGKEYLLGSFSIADAYLYTIARWSPKAGIGFDGYPELAAFMTRMESRAGVALALEEEGLSAFGTA
jgi:glutathione S-transferase